MSGLVEKSALTSPWLDNGRMGRAKGGVSAVSANANAMDGFAIFGRYRGRPERDRITAEHPSALARAEQALLLEAIDKRQPREALEVLAKHAAEAAHSPLLLELVDAIGVAPLAHTRALLEPWLRATAQAAGVRSERSDTLVINHKKLVHIWPEGGEWEGFGLPPKGSVGARTVCGRDIAFGRYPQNWQRARRGTWFDPAHYPSQRVCAHCARHAHLYDECNESRDFPPFSCERQRRFELALPPAFRATLLTSLQEDSLPEQRDFLVLEGWLRERAYRAYRVPAIAALVEVVIEAPQRALSRITNTQVQTPDLEDWTRALTKIMDLAFAVATGKEQRNLGYYELRDILLADLGIEGSGKYESRVGVGRS